MSLLFRGNNVKKEVNYRCVDPSITKEPINM